MKILVAESESYSDKALEVLRQLGTVSCADIQDRASLIDRLGDVDILVVRLRHQVDGEVMNAAPNLRVIVSPTTGLDHIDLDEARVRGISVLSLKGETDFLNNVTATAELTWALILELARSVGRAHSDVLGGRWDRNAWVGRSLKGRTLGLLGFGRLGRIVADYGQAFRMEVVAHDPFVRDFPPGVRSLPFKEVLQVADILSVHVPLEAETVGLLGRGQFDLLKPGAWLVNTSRGRILDEAALLDALRSGRVGAAALDVLAEETAGGKDWLERSPLLDYARRHDNLVLTPHIGGATRDAMAETEIFMAKKLRAFVASLKSESGGLETLQERG